MPHLPTLGEHVPLRLEVIFGSAALIYVSKGATKIGHHYSTARVDEVFGMKARVLQPLVKRITLLMLLFSSHALPLE